jgi:membrane protein DedA with SNARE-associated domain
VSLLTSLFATIFAFVTGIITRAGYAGIFGLMILQGATLPVPSEVVLPFVGYLSWSEPAVFYFWTAVFVACVGSLVGNLIDFAIGYYLGRTFILKYGRYVRLNEKHLSTSERWFSRYGSVTVFLARFVPLISTLVAFPAGISKMSLPKFIGFSIVGIFIWDSILVYIGFEAGANYETIARNLNSAFTPIEIVAVVAAAVAILLYVRRRRRAYKNSPETN